MNKNKSGMNSLKNVLNINIERYNGTKFKTKKINWYIIIMIH